MNMQYMYIRRILNNTNLTFSSKSSWSTKINSLHVMATNFFVLITSPIYIRSAQIGKISKQISCYLSNIKECTSQHNWMIVSYQKLIPLKLFYLIIYAISSWEIFTKKRQNWNGYKRVRWTFFMSSKTCLYFIFNMKLCWQRRFLPFLIFLFLISLFTEGLKEHFSKFGDIAEVMVMKDPTTRRSRYEMKLDIFVYKYESC